MKTHNEFMEEARDANSLPAQTQRALGPESEEDIAMYANDSEQRNDRKISSGATTHRACGPESSPAHTKDNDANCEGGEKDD